MPQKLSLYQIIHSNQSQCLRSIEKLLIAKKIAKAMFQIQNLHRSAGSELAVAHSHLSSKNVFINMSDM